MTEVPVETSPLIIPVHHTVILKDRKCCLIVCLYPAPHPVTYHMPCHFLFKNFPFP